MTNDKFPSDPENPGVQTATQEMAAPTAPAPKKRGRKAGATVSKPARKARTMDPAKQALRDEARQQKKAIEAKAAADKKAVDERLRAMAREDKRVIDSVKKSRRIERLLPSLVPEHLLTIQQQVTVLLAGYKISATEGGAQ